MHDSFRSTTHILALVILFGMFIVMCFQVSDANPIYFPEPTPPPTDIPDGGLIPTGAESHEVRFFSEDITFRLEAEYAFVNASYTFLNEGNTSVNATIFLPFSNLNPYINGLMLIGPNGSIPFTWSQYNLTFHGSTLYHSYTGVLFTVPLEPNTPASIQVTYFRPYPYNEYYDYSLTEYGEFVRDRPFHEDWNHALLMDRGYFNMYVYLTRTGSLWEHPIEEATFTFLVNTSICEGEFFNGRYNYDLYFDAHRPFSHREPILYDLSEHTYFLWNEPTTGGNYYRLSKSYTNWTPTSDIGVTWVSEPPLPVIEYEFDNSTFPGTFNFSASKSVDDDGTIVNYTWILGPGKMAYGPEVTHTYPESSNYSVTLVLTDDSGYTAQTMKYFEIRPSRTTFEFSADTYQPYLEPGNNYTGEELYIIWKFGDGTTALGRNVTHRYPGPGEFNIVLQLYNKNGRAHSYDTALVMDFDPDGDGFPDSKDDFPDDPAAHRDSDGDDSPDNWNPGTDKSDSTTNLSLDAFPDDRYASVDTDGDGYPDSWNDGIPDEDMDTDLQLDIYPNDPTRWKTESESELNITVVVAAVIFMLIVAGSVLMMRKDDS